MFSLVLCRVEDLCTEEQSHIVDTDCNEDFVASSIEWLVVVSIDLWINE